MGTLTVREKEHWKERITRKIAQTEESLLANTEPSYLDQLKSTARLKALDSLGISELYQRWQSLKQQEAELEKQRNRVMDEMLATACGITEERRYYSSNSIHHEVAHAIERRQLLHEKELMTTDELGRKLLELDREREELLDTVWLATSGKQVKQLWQKVATLLNDSPTPLQKDALAIEPIESD